MESPQPSQGGMISVVVFGISNKQSYSNCIVQSVSLPLTLHTVLCLGHSFATLEAQATDQSL